jgi:peptidyl-prolyl cis-trans isomerase SurA
MRNPLILCLALLLPLGAAAQVRNNTPINADRIVAVVNSEAITRYELQARIVLVERQLRGQNVQLPARDVLEKQILERLIVERAQLQLAKEAGLTASDGELDAALGRIAGSNQMSVSDFRKAIERDGIVWNKFREEIRQEMVIARLREREVDSQLAVSEGEIDNYLASNEQSAGGDDVVHVAHIVVRVPEQANAQQLERSNSRARQAMEQLKAGEAFGRVAAAFSDASDGLTGGVMDARPVDRLPGLYADAVRKMKPGETSAIMRSPAGFHIVRLLDRRGGAMLTLALKQTHARHILIKVNEIVSDDDAHQRTLVLKERLDNGADFADLARQHSNDLSASQGGDLGWLYEGDTVPEFEKAMDALQIKEVSVPVRSPFGWHLIQVLERRTEDATRERRRLMARQTLRERKSEEAYQDWLRQLRDRAYVEYRLEEK